MSKAIMVTVDEDVHLSAQQKLGKGKLSAYINDCLKAITMTDRNFKKEELLQEREELENKIKFESIRIGVINNELSEIDMREKNNKKLLEERERFKRWVCPVCKTINLMDQSRCAGRCGLSTRDSSKTTFTFINEEK